MKRRKKQSRSTLAKKISNTPHDGLKLALAKYGTVDYHAAGGLEEVSAIIRHESDLRKGIYASWGGKDAEASLAAKCAKCIPYLRTGDADFFKKLSHEVRRQMVLHLDLKENTHDPFRLHLLLFKNVQRWRKKCGLLPLTLKETKALSPKFAGMSDRHWHKVAKSVGLQFFEGKSGRPKTPN